MKALLLLFFLAMPASAAQLTGNWVLKSSTLTYTATHPLKTTHGKSTAAKGKGQCSGENCEFLVAVPVKSFDSGDSNRDLHMLETVRGANHPLATVRIKGTSHWEGNTVPVEAVVDFGGKQHRYEGLRFESQQATASAFQVKGTLKLSLKDFEIKAPSLFAQEVKDEVPIAIDLAFIRP